MKSIAMGALAICALWIAWPYYSLYQLSEAVDQGDEIALESLVDWTSLKQGLKGDLAILIAKSVAAESKNEPGSALAAGFLAVLGPVFVDKIVDAYVTPQGLAQLFKEKRVNLKKKQVDTPTKSKESPTGDNETNTENSASEAFWNNLEYAFFTRSPFMFLVELKSKDKQDENQEPLKLLMKWQNGGWELTRLILPMNPDIGGKVVDAERGKAREKIKKTTEEAEKASRKAKAEKASRKAKEEKRKQEYIQHVKLYGFEADIYDTYLENKVPGVKFKLKNEGNQTLKSVKVTVYFKDAKGKVIHEENFYPISASSWRTNSGPLKPGYIWQLERGKFYKVESVPTEWKKGSAKAQITDIEFTE